MKENLRRPIILKRRKLPFQKTESDGGCDKADGLANTTMPAIQCFPDGIRIMDHPNMPDTQVVVIPKAADLQSVISALTAKGKECGPHGRNKFVLLGSATGSEESNPLGCLSAEPCGPETGKKETKDSPLDDSLTNMQWLGKMSTDENIPKPKPKGDPLCKRPPYSYMAMIQFAINSKRNRKMTLKEIYNWIEEHFPYFKNVAKPGWKNSIRHNLSLHNMFVRESSSDGKNSVWTIRPDANRCVTLVQSVVEPVDSTHPQIKPVSCQQQQKKASGVKKMTLTAPTERRMKPLLPRTSSYLVPIQLPLARSLFLPSSSSIPLSSLQHPQSSPSTSSASKKAKKIAPKVSQTDVSALMSPPPEVKEECVSVLVTPERFNVSIPKFKRENSSSRRKQRLVLPVKEEPVLLYHKNSISDSGVDSDFFSFQAKEESELKSISKTQPDSPILEYTFKTPIKSCQPSSSTPSKPPVNLEPWRVTPVGKEGVLDFSPIRTPCGLQLTPQRHEHISFSSTPFKELPLFNSPRELLTSARSSPRCSREQQAAFANGSLTEGLILDTMNDSLSKVFVDISFSALEDDDLGTANISWSQIIPELK